ncbi:hypothetical protein F66182_7396 [Fusarium sp. NRRL 66182]|nr:hypothetical protein F66182_7396 [Fusarium sp. NRRL 66182]
MPRFDRTSPRTDSPAAIEQLESWMLECENASDHEDCLLPQEPELPKRVVEVGDDDDGIRLVETHGSAARYFCLSHCWGEKQIITTKQATLEDRKRRINIAELSNTFRDAIRLTRRLEVQYIWIDSLCIIQDDIQDWKIESAKMASIYSNAHLTIAATHSSNGDGGLYKETPDFEVSGTTQEGDEYSLVFRQRIDHHLNLSTEPDRSEAGPGILGHGTIAHHPLLTRAWVYQERLLSPRIVHFGPYELFYECFTDTICECSGINHHGSSDAAPITLVKLLYSECLFSIITGVEWHEYAAYYMARVWRTMVCSYTALGITKPSDRLPAIGGLAKKVATVRKCKYLAGLWETALNDDLIWSVFRRDRDKSPRQNPSAAPTWSWASVETHVWYWDIIYHWDPEECLTDEERPPYQHFSQVKGWHVESAGLDEFGHCERGTIEIEGLVAEGVVERQVHQDQVWGDVSYYVRFSPDTRIPLQSDYRLDSEGPYQVLPGAKVLCMRMTVLQEGKTEYLVSLVLRAIKGTNEYERIGTMLVTARPPPIDTMGGIYMEGQKSCVTIR